MAMNKSRKVVKRKREPISPHVRLVASALCKLEIASPHNPYGVLTATEKQACIDLLRAAVEYAKNRTRAPRSFIWRGVRYNLAFSILGRLFIVSPKSGRTLISSDFFAV